MKKTLKWFTLIEMLIVIVIIGILAAVLIPKIGWAREKAEDVAVKANVKSYAQAIIQMQLDNKTSEWASFTALNTTGNAEKYWSPYISDTTEAAKYSLDVTGSKFLVCWTVSNADWGNASSTWYSSFSEGATGTYYCYKG